MLCAICNYNYANTFISKNINGIMTNVAVCNECLKKSQFAKFFISSNNVAKEKECENCKATISLINKTGRLGCFKCYETFKDNIEKSLDKVQIDNVHRGKSPIRKDAKPTSENNPYNKKEQLKEQLVIAINEENFEKAALLRDMIKELGE